MTAAPGSTVLRMVQNAMNIMNIEVETGWTKDAIKALALEEGYAPNASNGRFQKIARPKPAPKTDTGAVTDNDATAENRPSPVPVSPNPDIQAAWITFFTAFTDLLRTLQPGNVPTSRPAARPNGGSQPQVTHGATQSQLREWARSVGMDVNPKGSVSREVRAAYAAAHPDPGGTP